MILRSVPHHPSLCYPKIQHLAYHMQCQYHCHDPLCLQQCCSRSRYCHPGHLKPIPFEPKELCIYLFLVNIDLDTIRFVDCWWRDNIIHYLQFMAKKLIQGYSLTMVDVGYYTLIPVETNIEPRPWYRGPQFGHMSGRWEGIFCKSLNSRRHISPAIYRLGIFRYELVLEDIEGPGISEISSENRNPTGAIKSAYMPIRFKGRDQINGPSGWAEHMGQTTIYLAAEISKEKLSLVIEGYLVYVYLQPTPAAHRAGSWGGGGLVNNLSPADEDY